MEVVDKLYGWIGSAFAVFCGERGEVTRQAREQGCSRQTLYREANSVRTAVEDSAARIAELEAELARHDAEIAELRARPQSPAMSPDKQAEFAVLAQAEGVSLPVARRLMTVVMGEAAPSVATLGRTTAAAGRRAGELLTVLDAAARPLVRQAAGDEIFLAANRS